MNILKREMIFSHVRSIVTSIFACVFSLFLSPKFLLGQQSVQAPIFGNDTTFFLNVEGTVDAINTRKYQQENIFKYKGSGVENNISFALENKSTEEIINPRIEINGKGMIYTMGDLVNRIPLNNLSTIDDTVKTIWHFLWNNYYHWLVSTEAETYQIKPVRTYNVYGAGQCENASQVICSILKYLGYNNTFPIVLNDFHTVGLLVVNGRSVILDADLKTFYTKRDNKTLVDLDSVIWDRELVNRQHHSGFEVSENVSDDDIALGYTDLKRTGYLNNYQDWVNADTMCLRIRAGEQIIFNYDSSVGNYFSYYHVASDYNSDRAVPPNSSLGTVKYKPALSSAWLNSVPNSENIKVKDSVIYASDSNHTASLTIDFRNPYVWTNGKIIISYSKTSKGILQISAKKDYQNNYKLLYEADTLFIGNRTDTIDLFQFIKPNNYPYRGEPMTNLYYVRIEWLSEIAKGITIDSLYFENNFQLNPNALPRLNLGANTIRVTNQNGKPFKGLVYSHSYKEINDYTVPLPPANPIFPSNGNIVTSSQFVFTWDLPNGMSLSDISDFNIQVSEYPDCRFPVSSTFNKLTSQQHDGFIPMWKIPHLGLLNPQTVYYWRVAVRNNEGVWSDWSNVWSFTINAPGVPVNPFYVQEGDSIVIRWETNKGGETPKKFYVLGSNERGFSYNDSLIIDATENNFYTIKNASRILNYAFYRVVAVDENNSKSGCSDLIAVENRLLCDAIPATIQSSDSLNIKLVKIEPIDFYGKSGSPDFTARPVCDSVGIESLIMPNGLRLENNVITGKVTGPGDSLIEIIGRTYLSGKEFTIRKIFAFNFSPEIVRLTRSFARSDSNFVSQIIATDLDGDSLTYSCSNLPQWLVLDSVSGVLVGTPSSKDAGDSYVNVSVKDDKGGVAQTRFTITVWAPSPYFEIVSVADTVCKVGKPSVITTTVTAISDYSNRIRFLLRRAPNWLTIDPSTGKIEGIPPVEDYGKDYSVWVVATDADRYYSDYNFSIHVSRENSKPQFLTLPDTVFYDGVAYKYQVHAIDADTLFGDTVEEYVLLKGPNWLTIDSSGLLSGIPSDVLSNKFDVVVGAIDAFGDTSLQTFSLYMQAEYILLQNFPNPFSHVTTIPFKLAKPGYVKLEIFNTAGQKVGLLVQNSFSEGYHSIIWNAAGKLEGVYFAVATISDLSRNKKVTITKRMLLVK